MALMKRRQARFYWCGIAVSMVLTMLVVSGCASQKVTQAAHVEKEYQRIIDQHQRKAAAREELEMQKKSPPIDDPEAYERSGDAYVRQGNADKAFIEYSKAVRLDPQRMGLRQKIGHLMLKKGLWTDGITEFDVILKQNPGSAEALQGKATALFYLDRLREAEECLDKAISINSASWELYALQGNVYDRTGRCEKAADSYRKALAINPKAGPVYENLGVSLYLTGMYQGSADAFLQALRLEPSNTRTCNRLGLVLFRMGMYPEALQAFKKGGDDGTAYHNMGALYAKDKKYEDAIDAFRKAIDAKPVYYKNAHVGLERARMALKTQQAQ